MKWVPKVGEYVECMGFDQIHASGYISLIRNCGTQYDIHDGEKTVFTAISYMTRAFDGAKASAVETMRLAIKEYGPILICEAVAAFSFHTMVKAVADCQREARPEPTHMDAISHIFYDSFTFFTIGGHHLQTFSKIDKAVVNAAPSSAEVDTRNTRTYQQISRNPQE